jgi:N-acetylmuramic acid 6-phosphate etherase
MQTNRSHLLTELSLPASVHLDQMSVTDALVLMNQQDALAVAAVAGESANVAKAIELVVTAFKQNGRLIYVGAGTSGRLGVLDASECPPTFRSEPEMVQGIIAGGSDAMFRAKEGAEDDTDAGAAAVDEKAVGPSDVVMGIATGGTTPYVHGALRQAIARGAKTVFFSCVQPVANEPPVDVVIRPLTGPEILTGSTRLKAGTATKLVLNQITTLAMVQIGKCYGNLMVDLRASNQKLKDRAIRILTQLTALSPAESEAQLQAAEGHVKIAVVMHHHRTDAAAARAILQQHDSQLRPALESAKNSQER